MVRQTLADPSGVQPICLDLLPRRYRHRARREDHTLNSMVCQLMIQAVPQTSGFIPTQYLCPLAPLALYPIDIFQHFPKCIAAILFWFWPGKDSDQTTVDSCYGWIRHIGRFHESRTYEFVLDVQLSNGDVEVFLLDKEMQPLLKLTQWFPTGTMELDGKSKYYLQWEFSGATGRCELRWSAE